MHFKNCWKSGPKVPTLRDQWPMAKGPLDHVGLSGNFMTIITENNQIFVYIQSEMKLLLIYHKQRNTIVCISAVKTWNAVEIQDFFITLILLSKEHVYCCTFRVILTLHEFLHFYYIIRQSYPCGSQPRCHLQCSGVPRANSFFNISLKMLHYFQNVIKPYSKLLCVRHWVPQTIFVSCRVSLQPKTVGKRWISPWSLLLWRVCMWY